MRKIFVTTLLLAPLAAAAQDTPDTFAVTAELSTSGSSLSSIGTAQFQQGTHNFTPASVTMEVLQLIYDAENASPIADSRITQNVSSNSWYSKILYGRGNTGRCYRGSISADGISFSGNKVAHNDANSGKFCIYATPPPPPEGGDDDPRDCVVSYGKYVEPGAQIETRVKRLSGDRCDPASPILIDIKGKEPEMSGGKDPVTFDILRRGTPIPISWTKRNSDTGFLVLDRNRNGQIDDGGELFGNHTDSPYGEPPVPNGHGFSALSEYDNTDLGGNMNGRIDEGDAIWSRLRIWVDRNHDGLTTPEELYTMSAAGITGIDRDYDGDHQKWDKHGNLLQYRGTAYRQRRNGREEAFAIYDVVFKKLN
ncbi:MAG: hypothetical protein LC796_15420 [Acidobacteria bacterium]|nr:hypothetical protein [Acidobacteriota bacterium]MCA1610426.1 hypothetical protein [Acidobacteriota bacterium]